MSSGPSDYRRRSRSPVVPVGDIAHLLNEQLERFSEHLRRNRRGKQHKRTSKSLLLTLLEFAVDASGRAASHVRRQTQISDTWTAVKHNRWFPRQGEPVLLRAEDSDLESEYAETVYPPQDQSEEEEEDSQWRPPEPDRSPPRRPREPDHPPPGSSSSSRVVPRASSVVVSDLRAVPKAKAAS